MVGRELQADTHTLADCFANPRSTKCKIGAYRQRVSELMRKNLPIPAYMCAPPPPEQAQTESMGYMSSADVGDVHLPPPPPRGHVGPREAPAPRQADLSPKEADGGRGMCHTDAQQVVQMLEVAV